MNRWWVVFAVLVASSAQAVSSEFRLLLDLDNNPATGCVVSTPGGDFAGVETILTTRVETDGLDQASVVGVERQNCVGTSFGPPQAISAGGWPVGVGNGDDGFNVVETFLPIDLAQAYRDVRIGLLATDELGNVSTLLTRAPGSDAPIVVSGFEALPVPTLGFWLLLLLAVLLLGAGLWIVGRRGRLTLTALVCLGAGGAAGAACLLDGEIFEWSLADRLAIGSATDPESGVDLRSLYGKVGEDGQSLCFRIDTALVFSTPPTAVDDAYLTVEATPLVAVSADGLLANDELGLPEATLIAFGGGDLSGDVLDHAAGSTVTIGADGAITVNADGSFEFQAASGFEGEFTFGYRIENVGGSSDATVVIEVQSIPVAVDDAFEVRIDENLDQPAPGVLANDSGLPAPLVASFGGGDLGGTVDDQPAGSAVSLAPDGSLRLDADGRIEFQPPGDASGEFQFEYRIENAAGSSTALVTITVNVPPQIVSADTLTCEVGQPCTFQFEAEGFPAPAIGLDGDLPAGLSFDAATATLAGTPEAGNGALWPLTVSASNGIEPDAGQAFSLTINESPTITSGDAISCQVGEPCSFQFTADGFPAPEFDLPGLPAGLVLDPVSGELSGTPAEATGGEYSLTLTAANNIAPDDTQALTLTIGQAPAITSADNFTCEVGQSCDFTFIATGFPAPEFDLPGLPAGLSLDPVSGALSGTPEVGTGAAYGLTLTASNGIGPDATQAFTLTVNEAPTITSANSLACEVGQSCDFTFTADGFPAPSFALPGLPAGLSLDATTGVLSGTPDTDTGAIYNLILTATNDIAPDATQGFSLTINEAPTITSVDNLVCEVGQSCDFTFTADGFPAPTFALPGLPAGLSLDPVSGALSGIPDTGTGAAYGLTLTASNGIAPAATQAFSLTVNESPSITSADSLTCVVGDSCSFTFTADGFPAPSFGLPGLPSGLSLDASTGVLSGTPEANTGEVYNLTLTATNGIVPDDDQAFTLTINEAPTITSADSLTCVVGEACSFTFTADGFPAASFGLPGLPAGLILDASTGALSGTPDVATGASYSLVLTASNGIEPAATQNFSLTVNESPSITSADSLTCVVGDSCSFTFTADGFPDPSFGLAGLPSGLSLDSNTGVLSGTPDANAGAVYNLTLTATNGIAPDDDQGFTLTINEPPTITSPDSLTCAVGEACSFTFSADGFPAPTFALPGLPAGLILDASTGALSGTPDVATGASYSLVLTASNGIEPAATQNFSLTVNEAPGITSDDSLTCQVGQPCSFTFTADGFPAPTFGLPGLPSGLSLDAATGVLSGTPDTDTGGIYNLTLTASNGIAPDATQGFTLTINQAPAITSANSLLCEVGESCDFTFTATGFPAPEFALPGLPAGLSLDPVSGVLSGTPAADTGAIYNLTLTATNGIAPEATQSFSLTINQAPEITSGGSLDCEINQPCSFQFLATGFPAPQFSLPGLPAGLSLDPVSGALSGTPEPAAAGTYNLTLTASNGVDPDATQSFTIQVGAPPQITSDASVTCTVGASCEFEFTASGVPAPTISLSGALPDGVSFDDTTASLEGTPLDASGGVYELTIEASNGFLPNASQSFTLTVNEAPVAVDDPSGGIPAGSAPGDIPYHGAFNTVLTVSAAAGVLVNDSLGFPQASIVNASPIATTGGGSVTLNADGSFGYTPATDFTGIDTFGYCIENVAAQDCATVELAVGQRPSAANATYPQTLIGNVGINTAVDSGFSVTAGGDAITLGVAGTTNGNATINANGTFTFNPAVGVTDANGLLDYSVSNGFGSVNATVTIPIGLDRIWFVDNSAAAGDGRLGTPFNSLAAVASAANAPADRIFLSAGSGSYAGGIALLDEQRLLGQGASLPLATIAGLTPPADSVLPATAGTAPQIVNTGGNAVNLASGNHLNGLAIGNTAGSGINGTGFGTLTVADVTIAGVGQALSLTSGSIAGAGFLSVSSTSGLQNIVLTNIGGTLNLGAGSLSGASGPAFEVNGGTANISYGGSITATGPSQPRPVWVLNRSAGTVALSGAISGANGIELTGNTGSTVAFTGPITLNAGANTAFQATGGGTVTATGTGSTLETTTGTALRVENTTIGAGNLNFQRISAGTAATGPANGIVLNNTGTSGGLRVTGTGTAGSGGLLRNTTGSAIRATSSHDLTLAWMNIVSPVTTSPPPNLFSGGLELNSLSGNGRLTRLDISAYNTANTHGISLVNNNTSLVGLILEGVTVRDSTAGANAVLVVGRGASDMTVTIQGHEGVPSSFTSLVNSGVRVNTDEGHVGTMNFSLLGANFQNVSTAGLTQPIVLAPFSNSVFEFAIDGNTINNSGTVGNNTGLINVAPGRLSAPGPTTVGSISNNTITNSTGFRAINVTPDTFAGLIDLTIDNNSIQGVARHGMFIDFRDSAGAGFTNRLRIRGNQIGNISPTAGGNREAILVDVRGNAAKTVNTVIGGAGALANTIVHNGDAFFEAVRVIAGRSTEGGAVVHNATVLNNSITQNGAAVGLRTQSRDVGTLCLNMTGTGFSPAGTQLQLNQSQSGTLNVTQASQAALQSANPGSSVFAAGTVQFGQPACPLP